MFQQPNKITLFQPCHICRCIVVSVLSLLCQYKYVVTMFYIVDVSKLCQCRHKPLKLHNERMPTDLTVNITERDQAIKWQNEFIHFKG